MCHQWLHLIPLYIILVAGFMSFDGKSAFKNLFFKKEVISLVLIEADGQIWGLLRLLSFWCFSCLSAELPSASLQDANTLSPSEVNSKTATPILFWSVLSGWLIRIMVFLVEIKNCLFLGHSAEQLVIKICIWVVDGTIGMDQPLASLPSMRAFCLYAFMLTHSPSNPQPNNTGAPKLWCNIGAI